MGVVGVKNREDVRNTTSLERFSSLQLFFKQVPVHFLLPFPSTFLPFRENLIPALEIEGHTQVDNSFGPMLLKMEKRNMLLLASLSLMFSGEQRPSVGQRAPSSAGQRLRSAGKTD